MARGTAGTPAGGTSTACACVCPAVSAGDTILFVAAVDSGSATASSGPSGFTQRASLSIAADNQKFFVYWKNAAGTEGGTTLTLTLSASVTWRCAAVTYTGRSTSLPATATTTISNTFDSPTVNMSVGGQTPAGAGCDAVYLATCDDAGGGCSYAADAAFTTYLSSDDGGFCGFTVADKLNTASATGTVTGVATPGTSGGYGAVLILLEASGGAAAAPFHGSTDPNPRGKAPAPDLRTLADASEFWLLKDTQFGAPGQGKAYDWPNPRGKAYPSDLRTFIDPSEVWLFGTDRQFAGPGQFTAYDWPNPRGPRRSIDALTWTSNGLTLRLPTGAVVAAPFGSGDWPNPIRALRAPVGNLFHAFWYAIDDSVPFTPIVVENPRGQRRYLSPRETFNLLQTTLAAPAVPAPFALDEWPNPIRRVLRPLTARETFNGLELVLAPVAAAPFKPIDWPNPRSKGRLRSFADAADLLETTLGSGVVLGVYVRRTTFWRGGSRGGGAK